MRRQQQYQSVRLIHVAKLSRADKGAHLQVKVGLGPLLVELASVLVVELG